MRILDTVAPAVLLFFVVLLWVAFALAQDWTGTPNTTLTLTRQGGAVPGGTCHLDLGWYGWDDSEFCPGGQIPDSWKYRLVDDAAMTQCNDPTYRARRENHLLESMRLNALESGNPEDTTLAFDFACTQP